MKQFVVIGILLVLFLFQAAPLLGEAKQEGVSQNLYGDIKLASDLADALKVADSLPDSAIHVVRSILPMLRFTQDSLRGMCHFVLGEAYYAKSDFYKARQGYSKSIDSFKKTGDKSRLATGYNNLGLSFYLQANYDSAMIAFGQSLKFETELDNQEGIAKSYQNIGLVFYQMDERDKAFSYMERAIQLYEKLGQLAHIAEVANNLAIAYIDLQDYDKAYFYYLKALKSFELEGDKVNQASVLNNLGSLYYYKRDFVRALEYLNHALEIFKNEKDIVGQIHVHSRIGDVYMASGKTDEALSEFLTCEQMNDHVDIRDVRINNLKSLSDVYRKLERFEDALRVSDQYHALQDSVYNEDKLRAVFDAEQQYDIQKARADLIKSQDHEKYTITLLACLFVVLVLLLVLILLLTRHLRMKERQRAILLEQKVLRSQMNPHFLFNALSAIQYYVLDNKMVEAIEYLGDFSKLIRMVLQSSQEEYVTIETEKAILEYYLNLQMRRFENKFSYLIHIDDDINVAQMLVPPMLAQPFIENHIEMGKLATVDDGQIWISFSIENHHLVYRIQDNGLYKINPANTRLNDNFSLAMRITRERIKLINQGDPKNPLSLTIVDLSKSGKSGNLIEFSIPIHKLH